MGLLTKIISAFAKGPAIQNLEKFDMVVKMKNGGVILPIVCSGHPDDSDEIFNLLTTKISNYLKLISSPDFTKTHPTPSYIDIQLNCFKRPGTRIIDELDRLSKSYSDRGIKFTWRD